MPRSIPYFLKCTIIFCKQQNHLENRKRAFYFRLLLKTNLKVMICLKKTPKVKNILETKY